MISLFTYPMILFGLFCLWAIVIYNRLVRFRQQVSEGWSGIDVQLKKRSNLIPNLVETVKGYTRHEKNTLTEVIESRGQCIKVKNGGALERGEAEGKLTNSLVNLFAVAENYPDLKANDSFLNLQHSLTEIENDIEMTRRYYNGAVRIMNIGVETFPNVFIAKQFSFYRADYFQIEDPKDRLAPGVKL
ncbi:LemA family protein [Kiloniella antarctica]|uniref:LemA family protein n=1 Tax=Kiloniella antarctica TaxID=1550907 RepID=A0ABW5BFF1_9PROT